MTKHSILEGATGGDPPTGGDPLVRLLAAADCDAATRRRGDAAAVGKLETFEAMIRRWNPRCGLVSRRDARRLRERHTLDSLALLPWWRGRLVDVGTGAGLPGVPLAIARPECPVVLVERSERKGRFLRQVLIDLKLTNVELALVDAPRYRPPVLFDTATARAMAPPTVTWNLLRPLLKLGGAALIQSREPLHATRFHAGAIAEIAQTGAASWVTVVRPT